MSEEEAESAGVLNFVMPLSQTIVQILSLVSECAPAACLGCIQTNNDIVGASIDCAHHLHLAIALSYVLLID